MPVYWEKMGALLKGGDKWALGEFTKIMVKVIPQDVNMTANLSMGDILNKLNADNSGATEK